MHSCNILHWSQFLRSIERILRDRNYYPLNVKHYSYTIEARGVGWGSQKESAVSGSDLYFTLKPSREVLWRHKLSRSEWCGLKIEQSGWHTECGPRLASYYKWLYVTHWEKCECEASQEQPAVIQSNYPDFNAASPPPHSSGSEGIIQLRPRFPVCCVLSDVECYS